MRSSPSRSEKARANRDRLGGVALRMWPRVDASNLGSLTSIGWCTARPMGSCPAGAPRIHQKAMRSRSTGRGAPRPLPLLVLGLGAALCLPVNAQAGPLARALDHLAARQDPVGGGFAVGPGTDPTYTEWAALAVAAAGEDTRRWRRGRASLRTALVRPMEGTTLAEVERATVALAAAGLDPRVATDRNLVREVLQAQRTDGTIGPDPSTTAWGILALTSGGLGRDSRAVRDAAMPSGASSARTGAGP